MTSRNLSLPIAGLIAGYLLIAAAVAAGMIYWRHSILADMSTPQAQSEWDQWRDKAAEQDGKHSPVLLTVPKSPQPPGLVLMRDYFAACLVGVMLPLSALYLFVGWLTIGVLRQPRGPRSS